ncbi:metal-sensing transcriptional repressor [Pseudidiomarina sp. GXY010]|uniref:Metal-sensing transcriptional repressor n=1 Tax=Pseudidiomarina fusca TaxID=2965078 RepID=A0ABU3KZD9_9GAMM|nr:metal-sensing transcriptional repressor [Pseudidiomarina sp. GXY010]MDT7526869.1 metal-sensing transcriptional repressor [Pseudidiomarina sp. GXY010]
MPHAPEEKKQALDAGAECPAILQQLAAVRRAVNRLKATVLESYLREGFPRSDSQNKSMDETISIVRSYLR